MKTMIEDVKFIQDGTMVFGTLYLENGYVERIDYKTPIYPCRLAIPGFIDTHLHGIFTISCEDTSRQQLRQLARGCVKRGITSFCPTLRAKPLQAYAKQLELYRSAFRDLPNAARYLGAHLEGPYLNKEIADSSKHTEVQEIDLYELEEFLKAYHEDIRIMTLAPELPHALEAIHLLHLYGIEVSLGHTAADHETTRRALEAGATRITHLCNRMPGFDHRSPCMMDAIITSSCMCEIVMDGRHIQRKMLEWLLPLLGCERVLAAGAGGEHGIFSSMGTMPEKENSVDLLKTFRWLYERFSLQECIAMCGGNAAKRMRCYTQEIGLGKKVDLLVLGSQLELQDVLIDGRSVL